MKLEEALTEVWRRVLVEEAQTVKLGKRQYAVHKTPRLGLREVDFKVGGHGLRGLEQNPQTRSRWGQLARTGKKVMQFLEHGRYIGVVVDGKLILYNKGVTRAGP